MPDETKTLEKPAERAKLVKMKRDVAEFPAPHFADVHPDEVKNYQRHGWALA